MSQNPCPMNVWNHTNGCDCAAKMAAGGATTATFPGDPHGLEPGGYEALAAEALDGPSDGPSEDDLDFARETLGPDTTDEEVVNLANLRLDRDDPERGCPAYGPRVGRNGYHDPNWGQDEVLAGWEASPGFVCMHDRMPPGTPRRWRGAHLTSANGTRWNVRTVPAGERCGRHPDYPTIASKDLIVFYDANDATPERPHGQMVGSYFIDGLDPDGSGQGVDGLTTRGLDIYGSEPAWKVDGESLRGVLGWARMALSE